MTTRIIRWGFIVALLTSLLFGTATAGAAAAQDAVDAALTWIQVQQLEDGGFSGGFQPESSIPTTADVVLAAAAGGQDASTWTAAGNSPLDYLAAQMEQITQTTANTAKTTLAAVAAGQDPTDFAGRDLVATLEGLYDAESGAFQGTAADHSYAMLALANAGEGIPAGAVDWLEGVQIEDGSWAFDGSTEPGAGETNTTALAIQALIAAGEPTDSQTITAALDYLRGQQNEDAGFPYVKPSQFGTESDANSTAFVIQALLAAGQSLDDWAVEDTTPMDKLLAFQIGESGAFNWKLEQPGENVLATVQAIPALARVPLSQIETVEAANPAMVPTAMPKTGVAPKPMPLGLVAVGLLTLALGLLARRRIVAL